MRRALTCLIALGLVVALYAVFLAYGFKIREAYRVSLFAAACYAVLFGLGFVGIVGCMLHANELEQRLRRLERERGGHEA